MRYVILVGGLALFGVALRYRVVSWTMLGNACLLYAINVGVGLFGHAAGLSVPQERHLYWGATGVFVVGGGWGYWHGRREEQAKWQQ